MTTAPVPIPVPDPESIEYWEGCKRHELLIQKCSGCGELRHYPRLSCSHCTSEDYEWLPSSGKGVLYSWIIVHPPTLPAFKEKVPYPVILVELEEGIRMVSNIVDCAIEDLRIDMPLEVTFDEVLEGVMLPKFRPVTP